MKGWKTWIEMSVAMVLLLAWKLRMKLSKKQVKTKRNFDYGKKLTPYDQEIARMEREICNTQISNL